MPYLSELAMMSGENRSEQIRAADSERRRTSRAALNWTIYITCGGLKHPLRTKTRDISSDGFYCFLNKPLKPGERIECDIVMPTHDMRDTADVAHLHCRARVVRIEQTEEEGEFGVACRIEDYAIVHGRRDGLQ